MNKAVVVTRNCSFPTCMFVLKCDSIYTGTTKGYQLLLSLPSKHKQYQPFQFNIIYSQSLQPRVMELISRLLYGSACM